MFLILTNNLFILFKSANAKGNKLTCDCRLSWLQKLRNETRSKRLRLSLYRLNCVMDNMYKTNLPTSKHDVINDNTVKTNQVNPKKITSDEYDDDEVDDKYDETMQDQENEAETKVEFRKRLIDIPADMLPCPDRLVYEASFSPPTQDEVKYYKASTALRLTLSPFNLMLLLIATGL